MLTRSTDDRLAREAGLWPPPAARSTSGRRLRVAFICPFDLDRLSGTPVRAKLEVQAVERQCEAHVVATGGSFTHGTVVTDAWALRPGGTPRFQLGRFSRGAVEALRDFRPDVVHAIGPYGMLAALRYRLGRPRTPIVWEMHGLVFREAHDVRPVVRAFLGAADVLSAALADRVVVMSHTQRAAVVRWPGVRAEKVIALWGPEDLSAFPHCDPPPRRPFQVGYLGNGNHWQGLQTLGRAAKLLRKHKDIRFLLAGFVPETDQELAVDNVVLAGLVPRAHVPDVLARCHVLVSPRLGNTATAGQYPQKLSAYLAAGRPVIGSDVNDQADVLALAQCGSAFPAGDAEALAAAILRMRDLPDAERLEMGRRARRFAERCLSTAAVRVELGRLYEQTLARA